MTPIQTPAGFGLSGAFGSQSLAAWPTLDVPAPGTLMVTDGSGEGGGGGGGDGPTAIVPAAPQKVPLMPRFLCAGLGHFDILLGSCAVFAPSLLAQKLQPLLDDVPKDWIQRTGGLWLSFAAFQILASVFPTFSKKPDRAYLLFGAVGALRGVEVLADLIFGTVAEGATTLTRGMIYFAPVFNLVAFLYLFGTAWRHFSAPAKPK